MLAGPAAVSKVESTQQKATIDRKSELSLFLRPRLCLDRCMLPRLANLARRTPSALRSFRPSPLPFQFPRTMSSSTPADSPAVPAAAVKETPRYALSPVPTNSTVSVVRTAAMLVIGDEVLNGEPTASAPQDLTHSHSLIDRQNQRLQLQLSRQNVLRPRNRIEASGGHFGRRSRDYRGSTTYGKELRPRRHRESSLQLPARNRILISPFVLQSGGIGCVGVVSG